MKIHKITTYDGGNITLYHLTDKDCHEQDIKSIVRDLEETTFVLYEVRRVSAGAIACFVENLDEDSLGAEYDELFRCSDKEVI